MKRIFFITALIAFILIARTIKAEEREEGISLFNEGKKLANVYRFREASHKWEQALKIFKELGETETIGVITGKLGIIYFNQGYDDAKALEYIQQALAIYRNIGDKESEGLHLNNIGIIYFSRGDYAKALEFYQQSLAINKESGNRKGTGNNLIGIGISYSGQGDYAKALEYLQQALAIHRNIGDKEGEGLALTNIGIIYCNQGDYAKALEFFQQALAVDKKIGASYELLEGNIGDAYFALGRYDEALQIYQKQNDSIRLGQYYLKQNNFTKAKKQFGRKLEEIIEHKDAAFMVSGWIGLGLAYEGTKEYQKAKENYQKAVEFMERQRESLPEASSKHFLTVKILGGGFTRAEAFEGLARVSEKLGQSK